MSLLRQMIWSFNNTGGERSWLWKPNVRLKKLDKNLGTVLVLRDLHVSVLVYEQMAIKTVLPSCLILSANRSVSTCKGIPKLFNALMKIRDLTLSQGTCTLVGDWEWSVQPTWVDMELSISATITRVTMKNKNGIVHFCQKCSITFWYNVRE